jgi:hypothetical protein
MLDRAWLDAPDHTPAKHNAHAAYLQADARATALSNLFLTRPIATLADAAVLSVHGFMETDPTEAPELARVFARIALVVGAAAGLDITCFGSLGTGALIKRHAGSKWPHERPPPLLGKRPGNPS